METVVRHRIADADQYGTIPAGEDATIVVHEVEPLSGRDVVRQRVGRHTREYTCRLYTLRPVDIADGDEVTVRGRRYQFVDVAQWKATGSRFDGRVILCGGGSG